MISECYEYGWIVCRDGALPRLRGVCVDSDVICSASRRMRIAYMISLLHQKVVFGFIACLGIVSFFIGTAQLKKNLWLNPNDTSADDIFASAQPAPTTTFSDVQQQQQDTDGDGLNDYAEINAYRTSPYLADTDGDKISDSDEIKNNTDPNCPAGTECGVSREPIQSSDQNASGTIDIAYLRDILIQSGFPSDQVATLSDAEVLATYQQLFAEFGANQGQGTSAEGVSPSPQQSSSQQVTPEMVRAELKKQGIPAEQVDAASDADIMKLFEEAQKDAQSGQ